MSTSLQFLGGAWRTMSVSERNLAGETIRTRAIAGNAMNWELADTLYATGCPQGGGMVRTATAPDATVTVSESFADGQSKREVSAARLDTTYSYDIHNFGGGGLWQLAQTGARWARGYTDIAGRVFRQERPAFGGGTVATESTYNLPGQLVSVTQPGLAPMLYEYNALGERIRSTLDVNNNGTVDFAGTDRITENETHVVASATVGGLTIAPARVSVSRVYGSDGQAVSTSTSYEDILRRISASESFGLISKSVRTMPVNGAWSEISTRADGVRTESVYADGRLAEQKTVGTDSSILSHVIYAYDDQGRPFRVTERRRAPGGDSDHVTTTAYYNSGTARSVATPANETSSWARDIMGRETVATLPDSSTRTTEHDAFGRVKKTYGSQTYPVEYGYNVYGEMETMKTWQDFAGNQGAAVTAWGREPATGLLMAKTDAANKAVTYTYDAAGHLLTRTWARGVTTTYGYDPATGDLVSTVYSDGTPAVGISYDRLGRQVTVTADKTAQSASTYRSDNLMPDTETLRQDLDGDGTMDFERVFARSYDALLRPAGFTLKAAPDAAVSDAGVTYGYEPVGGRFGSVSALTAQGNVAFSYAYELGRAALLASVSGPAHTVRNVWEPERDVLKTKTNLLGDGSTNTVVSAFDYQVNNLGQRTSVATSGNAFAVATGWQWGYDALGQVTSAAHVTNSAFTRGYNYDDIGNRKQSSEGLQPAQVATTYATNALNQYTGITPAGAAAFNPTYDLDGNQLSGLRSPISGAALTCEWDAENRLKLVKDAQGNALVRYAYDAQSRLIRTTQVGPGTTAASAATGYVYDGWNCVAQYNLLTQPALLLRRQTWGLDLSGSEQDAGGVGGLLAVESLDAANLGTWFPTYDGNGNVSEYLGPNGGIVAHFEYDAFGNVISSAGNAGMFDCRFSTKPQDAVTGLYYYGYRWYEAVNGRWPSRDPIAEKGGSNLHGFINNSSINAIDYLGFVDVRITLHREEYDYFGTYGTLTVTVLNERLKTGTCCHNVVSLGTYRTIELPPGGKKPKSYNEDGSVAKFYTGLFLSSTSGKANLAKDRNPIEEIVPNPDTYRPSGLTAPEWTEIKSLGINTGIGAINIHAGLNSQWSGGCILIGTNYTKAPFMLELGAIFNKIKGGRKYPRVKSFEGADTFAAQVQLTYYLWCAQKTLGRKLDIDFRRTGEASLAADPFDGNDPEGIEPKPQRQGR